MAGHTTPAWKWLMGQLLALEPGTEDSGMYGNKPGYHGSRTENEARDAVDGKPDYSVRDAVDKLGPSDTGAAGDWTHRSAQSGNYASMDKYGERLEAAFNGRDPRLAGWREALGQTDLDAPPEALDFRYWTRRVPDSTHSWHWHFSEARAYSESYDNKKALLSVLKGETLAQYLAAGGVLLAKDGSGVIDMEITDSDMKKIAAKVWAYQDLGDRSAHDIVLGDMRSGIAAAATAAKAANDGVVALNAKVGAISAVDPADVAAALADNTAFVAALASAVAAVVPTAQQNAEMVLDQLAARAAQ